MLAPNWLGDAIMALPAIRDVRRHYSGQPLTIAARPSISSVFRAVPGIDRIIVLERGKEAAQLRGDIGILFPNSFRSAWIAEAGRRQGTLGLSHRFPSAAADAIGAEAERAGAVFPSTIRISFGSSASRPDR